MSNKPDLSIERKNQILDAAMETFVESGIHKARMSDIAETSGLSKGSLYWYFDSKDAIILGLLERLFEPELKDFRALLNDDQSFEHRLDVYVERFSDDLQKMVKRMPLIYDFIALAFRQKVIKKAISSYYNQNIEILVTLIQQGIDRGEVQVKNAEEAAIAIGSILEGTILFWFYDPDHIDLKYHFRSNIKLLLHGLKGPYPAKPIAHSKKRPS